MNKKFKNQLIESIETIYLGSKKCELDETKITGIKSEIEFFSKYLKCNIVQTLLITIIYIENLKDKFASSNEICKHFEITPIKLLKYNDEIEELIKKDILLVKSSSNSQFYRNRIGSRDLYSINTNIIESIASGTKINRKIESKLESAIDIFEKIGQLFHNLKESGSNYMSLKSTIYLLFKENSQYPLINKIGNLDLDDVELSVYSRLIWATICGNKAIDLPGIAEVFFPSPKERFLFINSFNKKTNKLIKNELVDIEKTDFFNNTGIKLSDKSFDMLAEHNIQLRESNVKPENIIAPHDIVKQELFYPDELKEDLDMLNSLLFESKRKKLKSKLESKALSPGLTVLLYGEPGTGKTETVYQFAKRTDREVMHVDISHAKSMWFGESEKIVKRIFKEYSAYSKKCKNIPILLFNEADAIISKRKDIESSNVAQTENAIQNIILEAMENFEGIMIATTNMINNIDPAFERRFLFKIKFLAPDIPTKAKLWASKLPIIKKSDCEALAKEFDLNGAQIDNIVRKCMMYEILNYKIPDIIMINKYCNEEKLNNKKAKVKIGF